MGAKDIVNKLLGGNERFTTGGSLHPNQSFDYRIKLASGQSPKAAILTCADSRVSPEIIFDQGLGDLFVLRVAGNVVNDMFLGSLEYAVEHLNVTLIMVLGHSQCGVDDTTFKGGNPPGHINSLIQSKKLAHDRLAQEAPDWVNVVSKENVKLVVEKLKSEGPILSTRFEEGDIDIVGAFYDLKSGKVTLIA